MTHCSDPIWIWSGSDLGVTWSDLISSDLEQLRARNPRSAELRKNNKSKTKQKKKNAAHKIRLLPHLGFFQMLHMSACVLCALGLALGWASSQPATHLPGFDSVSVLFKSVKASRKLFSSILMKILYEGSTVRRRAWLILTGDVTAALDRKLHFLKFLIKFSKLIKKHKTKQNKQNKHKSELSSHSANTRHQVVIYNLQVLWFDLNWFFLRDRHADIPGVYRFDLKCNLLCGSFLYNPG